MKDYIFPRAHPHAHAHAHAEAPAPARRTLPSIMRHLVFCAAMALALTVGGCGVVGLGSLGSRTPSDRTLPKGPQAAGRSDPSRDASRKKVASKEEPNTLVADDRTICFVTPEDFRATRIGDSVSCVWTLRP